MEASRPIDSDIVSLLRLESEADCRRSSLEYRFSCIERKKTLDPFLVMDTDFSGAKLALLDLAKRVNLDHSKPNLRFIKLMPCHIRDRNLKRQRDEVQKKKGSFETQCAWSPDEVSPKSSTVKLNIDTLLDALILKFQEARSYKLKDMSSERLPGTFTASECISTPLNLDLNALSDKDLVDYCTKSKLASLGLQSYLAECSQEKAEAISKILTPFIPNLVLHQFGNYVIQRVTLKELGFGQAVADHCLDRFEILIHNEFGSRVLQCLIESIPAFYTKALDYFSNNLDQGLQSMPATHLVVSCIKNARNPSDSNFVPQWLAEYPKLFWNKAFQRVLSMHIQTCSMTDLDDIFHIAKIDSKLSVLLNSKMTTFFLVNMLLRKHEPTTKAFLTALNNQPSIIFDTKCWKLFLAKLWEESNSDVTSRFALALTNLDQKLIRNFWKRPPVFYFYVYVTLRSLQVTEMPLVDDFLKRQEVSRLISGLAYSSIYKHQASQKITRAP